MTPGYRRSARNSPRSSTERQAVSKSLGGFVPDASEVVKSNAHTAVLSHAYSALMACTNALASPKYPSYGSSATMLQNHADPTKEGPARAEKMCNNGSHSSKHGSVHAKRPRLQPSLCLHETTVETAQKRAYAGNCWSVLTSKCNEVGGQAREQEHKSEIDAFVAALTALARTDNVVLVSLCLVGRVQSICLVHPCQ